MRKLLSAFVDFANEQNRGATIEDRECRARSCSLTFDDGPDPVETPRVLDCLARHKITATFFLLGKHIAGNEPLVKRIAEAGHAIGNHSTTHPRFKSFDMQAVIKELAECQRTIRDACDVEPELARPPFGRCTLGYWLAARRLKLRVKLWTLDSGDWRCRSAADAERCAEEVRTEMKPGDTILFHDNHPWIVPILERMFSEESQPRMGHHLGIDAMKSSTGYDLTPPNTAERAALAADLTPEERRVLLHSGTEPPFCGGLLKQKGKGTFNCRLCALPLFKSTSKFESGSGWPSFYEGYDPQHVLEIVDDSHGMVRTEIRCGKCDSHLGHVFSDGPRPTGLRYCLNSAALKFAVSE